MESNPYQELNTGPNTLNSVVVYLDVLGVSDEIRETYKAKDLIVPINYLRSFKNTLNKSIENIKDRDIMGIWKNKKNHWEVKAFTDNIVLGYPIADDGEPEMGTTFFNLSLFQLEMVLSGLFVRGAFSIGEHYMDEDIVFGNALLEAYSAEQNIARDPRIILTGSAIKYLKRHLKYYGYIKHSPQYKEILRDVDGQFFINYLDMLISDDGIDYENLNKHRTVIEEHLRKFKSVPKIWSKYSWVANYHNYFCEQRSDIDNKKYKVNSKLFILQPTRIKK
jgi:hypothetical protein